ncbi:MAG TPA: helix-turn-helix domain-containing protein [Stellaceae bacterium]|nr:helix-turn-helix domain-containing protein [Stellaceae bacterium]
MQVDHRDCPVFTTLSLIANKWSVNLLSQLLDAERQTLRFSALKRAMSGVTQRELTKHLRQFEASGIVERRVWPESPPRVEYALTPLGRTLCQPIQALSRWAEEHGAEVQAKRVEFARRENGRAASSPVQTPVVI